MLWAAGESVGRHEADAYFTGMRREAPFISMFHYLGRWPTRNIISR